MQRSTTWLIVWLAGLIGVTAASAAPHLPPVGEDARQALAKAEHVDPDQVEVVLVEEVNWRDGSLGLPQPDRMYTMALVDGYRIVFRVGDQLVAYHTGRNHFERAPAPEPTAPSDLGELPFHLWPKLYQVEGELFSRDGRFYVTAEGGQIPVMGDALTGVRDRDREPDPVRLVGYLQPDPEDDTRQGMPAPLLRVVTAERTDQQAPPDRTADEPPTEPSDTPVTGSPVQAEADQQSTEPALRLESVVYVPVRTVAEWASIPVAWQAERRSVLLGSEALGRFVEFTPDAPMVMVRETRDASADAERVTLPAEPVLRQGRMYVPAELFTRLYAMTMTEADDMLRLTHAGRTLRLPLPTVDRPR